VARSAQTPERVSFGDFLFDFRTLELLQDGAAVKLQPQPAKLLAVLIQRAGQVVTRQELAEQVWGSDTFVDFEHGLNFAIRQIRTVLGDDSNSPRFLETLPKRGYRFIATVVPMADSSATQSAPSTPALEHGPAAESHVDSSMPRHHLSRVFAIAAVVILILVVAAALTLRSKSSSSAASLPIHSIAILPLQNLSGDSSQDYFADGMTEELTTRLAKISSLRITSRTSTIPYKGTQKPLRDIARELGVDAVVEGSVVRSGDRVRITAQLIDGRSDTHLWAEKYERDLRDVLSMQSAVAEEIAHGVGVTLSTADRTRLHAGTTVDPAAHEEYLKATFYWNRLNCEGFKTALAHYQQASALDPNFALAVSGQAESYFSLADWACIPQAEGYSKARAAAEKALQIDPTIADPHGALGDIAFFHDWDWTRAENEYRRALDLDPSNAGNHSRFAIFLISRGQPEQGIAEWKIAHELDPVSELTNMQGSYLYYLMHDFDQAIVQGKKTLELYPNSGAARYWMAQSYEQKGMFNDAIDNYLHPPATNPLHLIWQKEASKAFDRAGMPGYWNYKLTHRLDGQPDEPCWQTLIYAHLKNKNETLTRLEHGFENRCDGLQFLEVEPMYDFIRDDPRYKSLLARLK
jgi:TolB-like protein/DNA-binding winged helix-turn-helix (wHTH) protein/Tfp pilus assembly protein PilF